MILRCCEDDRNFNFHSVHRELFPSYRLEATNKSAFVRSQYRTTKALNARTSFLRNFEKYLDFSKYHVYFFSSSRQFLRTYFNSDIGQPVAEIKVANYSNSAYLSSCISEIFPSISLNISNNGNHLFICDFSTFL